MSKFIFVVAALVLSLGVWASETAPIDGLIAQPSRHSAGETVNRLEAALKASGMTVFGRLDHSQAAESVGLTLKPLMVVVFGNPKNGTPNLVRSPTLGIDLPQKFLVWEDTQGQVWLAYNSAEYLHQIIRPRHGLKGNPAQMKSQAALLEKIAHSVVQ